MTGDFVSLKTFDDAIAFLYDEIDRLSEEAVSANDEFGSSTKVKRNERSSSTSNLSRTGPPILRSNVKLLGQAIANLKKDENKQNDEVRL